MTKQHVLKISPKYFSRVIDGSKNFEIRKNDRDYQTGDKVILMEQQGFLPPTGASATAKIGYVTDFEQQEGFVVFSLLDICVDGGSS